MFTNGFGWPHVVIILAVVILLFGWKRLPDAARGLGKSMRIFKTEMRSMRDEDEAANSSRPTDAVAEQLPPAQSPVQSAQVQQPQGQSAQSQVHSSDAQR
ncbi:MAG: Sec-independent protein translocase subunit TatA [Sciscionella sp.]|nr:Sec-independent protein translocase subunit TatA [Sciscionella sp.]